MVDSAYHLIGKGVYSLPEASRLTGIPAKRIRRWLEGYSYRARGRKYSSPAVFAPATGRSLGELTLTFADMIEVRFLDAFIEAGVTWRTVRLAAIAAKELLGRSHPFSSKHFMTDGKNILAQIAGPNGLDELFDLVKSQYEFVKVVRPLLFRQLDFNEFESAHRWWPMGKNRMVVLDPLRSFGAPIVSDVGVPTAILAAAARAERSQATAALYYDVPVRAVRDAVAFEKRLVA